MCFLRVPRQWKQRGGDAFFLELIPKPVFCVVPRQAALHDPWTFSFARFFRGIICVMFKHNIFIGGLLIAAIGVGFLIGWFVVPKETPMPPPADIPEISPEDSDESKNVVTANEIIRVTSPEPGVTITNPVTVAGEARTFEANVLIRIRDGNGVELAHTFTTALTPDMGVFGPFSVSVRYREPGTTQGFVEAFESSAKDGSEINMIRIPVVFGAQEWTSVQLFFSPQTVGNDCSEAVVVTRRIPKTSAIGRATLEELLEGPTDEERANFDVETSIPSGVTLRSLNIRDGVAYVDFDSTIETGGSCRVTAIRAQITQTLLQFPTSQSVVIAVEGNAEEALQP